MSNNRSRPRRPLPPDASCKVYEMILHGDDGELGRRRSAGGVPEGRVTTYGAIAAALGSKKVARHVGWALNALSQGSDDLSELVPWWRVVNSRGEVSFRPSDRTGAGGSSRQAELLEAEGIVFTPGPGGTRKIKDFDELLWTFEPQT